MHVHVAMDQFTGADNRRLRTGAQSGAGGIAAIRRIGIRSAAV